MAAPQSKVEDFKLPKIQLQGGDLIADLEEHRSNDILTYVFGLELQKQFNAIVHEHCNGCQIDHPSQLEHMCLWLEDDDFFEVDEILTEALAKVDIAYVKALYVETANVLRLDISWPLNLFDQLIKGHKKQWEQLRRFGVVVTAIHNMNFIAIPDLQELMQAVDAARAKVDKLEERISRSSSKD